MGIFHIRHCVLRAINAKTDNLKEFDWSHFEKWQQWLYILDDWLLQ